MSFWSGQTELQQLLNNVSLPWVTALKRYGDNLLTTTVSGFSDGWGGFSDRVVWDDRFNGDFNYPTAATAIQISSSSAGNTGLTFAITGLDTNWDFQTENITTDAVNGQTAVTGTNSYRRIFSMQYIGTTTPGFGDIYLSTNGAAVPGGTPAAGDRLSKTRNDTGYKSQNGTYTIRNNYYGLVLGFRLSAYNSTTAYSADGALFLKDNEGNMSVEQQYAYVNTLDNGTVDMIFPTPIYVREKTDISVMATASNNAAKVVAPYI